VAEEIKAARWTVPQELTDKLIKSMPRRIKAVRKVMSYSRVMRITRQYSWIRKIAMQLCYVTQKQEVTIG
jgi:hypothetical protein